MLPETTAAGRILEYRQRSLSDNHAPRHLLGKSHGSPWHTQVNLEILHKETRHGVLSAEPGQTRARIVRSQQELGRHKSTTRDEMRHRPPFRFEKPTPPRVPSQHPSSTRIVSLDPAPTQANYPCSPPLLGTCRDALQSTFQEEPAHGPPAIRRDPEENDSHQDRAPTQSEHGVPSNVHSRRSLDPLQAASPSARRPVRSVAQPVSARASREDIDTVRFPLLHSFPQLGLFGQELRELRSIELPSLHEPLRPQPTHEGENARPRPIRNYRRRTDKKE